MESVDKETVINEIISVNNISRNFDKESLNLKNISELITIRYGKKIMIDIGIRNNYQQSLFELDPNVYNIDILNTYTFDKIKELYDEFIHYKPPRDKLIQEIIENSSMKYDKLTKLSTKRLTDKLDIINIDKQKSMIIEQLKEYGDSITRISTPKNIQVQRCNFLISNGTKEDGSIRYELVKKTAQILKKLGKRLMYKHLMTENIEILKTEYKLLYKEYHKNSLINYLLEYYSMSFLKKQKIYVLEYLKSDLQPCERGSRAELIRVLASKNIWSRNTIRNWDVEKLKQACIKHIQDIYSPLSEYIPPNRPLTKNERNNENEIVLHPRLIRSREEILKDLTEILFFDLVCYN